MNNTSIRFHTGMNRQAFVKAAVAGAALLGASPLALRGATGANDRISIGCIGVGGRGSALMGEIVALADQENVQIAAVCDVWSKNRQAAAKRIETKFGKEPRQCSRFQELLAMKDVDAVVIATPDFSHGPILTAALKAGKDVYIEKPMTIDLAYANEALDLARANERVVQAGTQRRSEGPFRGAAKLFATGVLGQVSRVSAAMYFNESRWTRASADCVESDVDWEAFLLHLPKRAFEPKLLRQWQLYRETSNGLPGLWMTHYADALHLVTGAKYPATAVAHGGVYVWKDGRDTSDTFLALLEYPEGFQFDWGMGLGNSSGVHFTVHGAQGTMDLEKWTISPDGGRQSKLTAAPIVAEPKLSHMGNWLQCLRSRQRPNADIQFGHQHAVATIMAAIAFQTGQRQKYNPVTRTIERG
ncbi:MAG: Gfo/Idh/MocA family oxidoreductase [Candidatus Sumerlaeota bacterium]|nr:Gfo/Idh/MocA family oxidoreductase [Candidatus Sumerlaeota bacterium]